jgi:putative zinc finger protein
MRGKESCREWRQSLGAYALEQLDPEQRVGVEAHLEGCAECRAEAESLASLSRLLPLADPSHFGPAPQPPPELADRVAATIGAERSRWRRKRRLRFGLALSGATAAVAAAVLAIFVLGSGKGSPDQHIAFRSLPPGVHIAATLEPHAFGTEIQMYVSGIRSGTLCRVFLRGPNGTHVPAGTFRYRYGDDSQAMLSSALDLSRTAAIGVSAGNRTFIAPVDQVGATTLDNHTQEDNT